MALAELVKDGALSFNCVIVVFLLAVVVGKLIINRYGQGLNHIPGPPSQSITQFLRAYQVWKGDVHTTDFSLHRKYGKIVRIGPRLLSVSDPNEINTIYGITTKFCKSSFYDPSTPYDEEGIIPDPFILKDKALHSRMKRNAANAYSLTAVLQQEPYADHVSEKLFAQLDGEADKGLSNVFDFGKYMHAYAMDAIFMISFGRSLNILEEGDKHKVMACFDTIMPYMATVGQVPWLHKYLAGNSYMAKFILGELTFETGLMDIASTQVSWYRQHMQDETNDGPLTFIERLLLNQKSNPKSLTDREMITHALGNITAGGDTTSITLRSIFYFVCRDPITYQRLCEEVRTRCEFPATYSSAQNLPFLNAVIKEALRLHPPMAIMLGRTVPVGGATICGHLVPEGTEVGIPAYVLHRDPSVFSDPEAWNPDRWLTSSTEHIAAMNRSFFAFGAGMHTCSGRHISMMEILKLVPSLLMRYDFELATPDEPMRFRVTMLAPQTNIFMKMRRRL